MHKAAQSCKTKFSQHVKTRKDIMLNSICISKLPGHNRIRLHPCVKSSTIFGISICMHIKFQFQNRKRCGHVRIRPKQTSQDEKHQLVFYLGCTPKNEIPHPKRPYRRVKCSNHAGRTFSIAWSSPNDYIFRCTLPVRLPVALRKQNTKTSTMGWCCFHCCHVGVENIQINNI
jgi:hypothetical protein